MANRSRFVDMAGVRRERANGCGANLMITTQRISNVDVGISIYGRSYIMPDSSIWLVVQQRCGSHRCLLQTRNTLGYICCYVSTIQTQNGTMEGASMVDRITERESCQWFLFIKWIWRIGWLRVDGWMGGFVCVCNYLLSEFTLLDFSSSVFFLLLLLVSCFGFPFFSCLFGWLAFE